MPYIILILVVLLLIALGFVLWYALPFILIMALIGWIYYTLTKKNRTKTTTYVFYSENPFENRPRDPQNPQLRAPRADSIDAEFTEEKPDD